MKKLLFSFGFISLTILPIVTISCNSDSNSRDDGADINAVMSELKNTFGDKQTSKSTAATLRSDLQRKNSGNESDFATVVKIDGFTFPQSVYGTEIKWAYEGVSENGFKDNGARFTIKFTVSKPGSYAISKQWSSFVESSDYLSDRPEDQLSVIFKSLDKDNFVASGNQTKTSATNMVNLFVPNRGFVEQLNYFGIQLDASNENFNYILNGENIRANESLRRVEGLSITITHKTQPEITRTTRTFSISGYATFTEEDCYIIIDELDDGLIFGSDITSTKTTHELELVAADTNNSIAHGVNGATVSSTLGLPTAVSEELAKVTELRGTTITYHVISFIDGSAGKQFTIKVKVSKSGTEKDFNFIINGSDYIPVIGG